MTLDCVEVDCHLINRPGQLGVALGRASSTQGLRVVNFHPSCCVQPPESIMEFYENIAVGDIQNNNSCCNSSPIETVPVSPHVPAPVEDNLEFEDEASFSDEEDLEEEELEEIDMIIEAASVEEQTVELPENFDLNKCINNAKFPHEHTQYQQTVNNTLTALLENNRQALEEFMGKEIDIITKIMKEQLGKEKVAQKEQTAAYTGTMVLHGTMVLQMCTN